MVSSDHYDPPAGLSRSVADLVHRHRSAAAQPQGGHSKASCADGQSGQKVSAKKLWNSNLKRWPANRFLNQDCVFVLALESMLLRDPPQILFNSIDPNQTLSSPDPVQTGSGFTRVLLECSILPAVLALGVARARPPAWRWKCCRAATGCQRPGTRDRN